ncbi:urotensin II-related peptide [Labrus bergylta]|uniref:Urotensin II-related peptide n=1 Tax=Labrus bergylta TaxID=56723 RepID=A0A3Q3EA46_9LABR
MLFRGALVSVMKVVLILIILVNGMESAPTERGIVKLTHPLPGLTHASAVPEKPSGPNPSRHLKQWFLSTKAAAADRTTRLTDRTTAGTITAAIKAGRLRAKPRTDGPDKQAQMLKMISVLEELHRTLNSTLSSRITIMPRANGRSSGRKNKVPPASDGGVKQTTAAPAVANSTASKTSADAVNPSLTGRNFRKSLPPQTKKTNKRVCFWKYCSQN